MSKEQKQELWLFLACWVWHTRSEEVWHPVVFPITTGFVNKETTREDLLLGSLGLPGFIWASETVSLEARSDTAGLACTYMACL